MTKSLLLMTTVGLLTLGACVVGSEDDGAELGGKADGAKKTSPIGTEAQALWSSYVAELDLTKLQLGCRPFQSELPLNVEFDPKEVGRVACEPSDRAGQYP